MGWDSNVIKKSRKSNEKRKEGRKGRKEKYGKITSGKNVKVHYIPV